MQEDGQEADSQDDACRVGDGRSQTKGTKALLCAEEIGHGDGTHEGSRNGRDPIVLLFLIQEHACGPEDDHGQGLVRPGEVHPAS